MPFKDREYDLAWHRAYNRRPEQLAKARERKERYRGTCEECGAATSGCRGPGKAPRFCRTCTARQREPAHGTASRYSSAKWRCRCDACRAAWAAYMRGYYRRRRAAA